MTIENQETNRTIVLPMDKTEHCSSTLDWTLNTVARPGDLLILLYVRPSGHQSVFGLRHEHLVDQHEQLDQLLKQEAHELLGGYAKRVLEKGFECKAITLVGDPREELELKIKKVKPSFVVMASKSSSLLSGILMGSVSKHVLHNCGVPVMIRPVCQ